MVEFTARARAGRGRSENDIIQCSFRKGKKNQKPKQSNGRGKAFPHGVTIGGGESGEGHLQASHRSFFQGFSIWHKFLKERTQVCFTHGLVKN